MFTYLISNIWLEHFHLISYFSMPKRCLVSAKKKKKEKRSSAQDSKWIETQLLDKNTNCCIRNPGHCKHPAMTVLLNQHFALQEKWLLTWGHFQNGRLLSRLFFKGLLFFRASSCTTESWGGTARDRRTFCDPPDTHDSHCAHQFHL